MHSPFVTEFHILFVVGNIVARVRSSLPRGTLFEVFMIRWTPVANRWRCWYASNAFLWPTKKMRPLSNHSREQSNKRHYMYLYSLMRFISINQCEYQLAISPSSHLTLTVTHGSSLCYGATIVGFVWLLAADFYAFIKTFHISTQHSNDEIYIFLFYLWSVQNKCAIQYRQSTTLHFFGDAEEDSCRTHFMTKSSQSSWWRFGIGNLFGVCASMCTSSNASLWNRANWLRKFISVFSASLESDLMSIANA